jgi:hypothetical protein
MMGGLEPITRTGFDAERYLLTAGVTPADLAAVCRRLVAQGPLWEVPQSLATYLYSSTCEPQVSPLRETTHHHVRVHKANPQHAGAGGKEHDHG